MSYRPTDCPLACFENLFKPNYTEALVLNKPIFVIGDMNCNMLKNGLDNKALAEVSSEFNLLQIIKSPTRITDMCQSLIDIILVSSPSLIRCIGVLDTPTCISDHLPVYVFLKLKRPKTSPSYIRARSYKNYDSLSFASDLAGNIVVVFSPFFLMEM